MKTNLMLLLVLCFLCSCGDNKQDSTLDSIRRDLSETYNQTTSKLAPATEQLSGAASDEIEKVFSFEYKVLELEKNSSVGIIEENLVQLGRERWECFSTRETESKLQFFCSRRPKSILRYIPRVF